MKMFKTPDTVRNDLLDRLEDIIKNSKDATLINIIADILHIFESSLIEREKDATAVSFDDSTDTTIDQNENLYKIVFSHSAPKDTEYGLKGYVLARNEREVYEYIDKEFNCSSWKDAEDDEARFAIDDSKPQETFRDRIIRLKGTINDEYRDFSEPYYGITYYGWELVAENCNPRDFSKSIELGIIKLIKEKTSGR